MKLFMVLSLFSCSLTYLNSEEAYVQIYSTISQRTEPIVGVLLTAENIALMKNFELSPKGDILTCKVPGVYLMPITLQIAALKEGVEGYLDVWLELNGEPVISSTSRQYVSKEDPTVFITVSALIELKVGDRVGNRIASSGKDIGIASSENSSLNQSSKPSYLLAAFKID